MSTNIQGQPHDRSALILYGSETGNSQEAAEQLGRITERLRFMIKVVEMNAVEIIELLKYSLVIFAVSTTGQGDVPANARKFWKSLLRKRLPTNLLGHVKFTTFGLGDSSYVKFNWAARKLHKRLEQLGAQEFYPRGEGDEQHSEGIDGAFLPWSLDLKSRIIEKYPLPVGILQIPDTELLPPKWTLELAHTPREINGYSEASDTRSEPATKPTGEMDTPLEKDMCLKEPPAIGEEKPYDKILPPTDLLPIPGTWTATVHRNVGLTPVGHWQDVRHIELLISKKIDYLPGDIVTIYPKNFPEDVDKLLDLMGWTEDADKPLTFNTNSQSFLDPTFNPLVQSFPTTKVPTLRSLLLHNLDITAIPRRFFFEILAKFTDDPMHRERLLEFSNPAFTDEFFDYATRPRRSILEVLADFPSVKLPWRWAPYIFPKLLGRQFSISSGGQLKHPDDDTTQIDICAAIVQYRTVLKKIRRGVCSRYLVSLQPGTKISISVTNGSFDIHPTNASKPMLLIAPGTGIAPMRSLLHERAYWIHNRTLKHPAPCVLIFGNRNKSADFLYSQEWSSPLFSDIKVLTAFSRDQPHKIYVQDIIRANAEMVYKMLAVEKGSVFICGSSGKMPTAVRNAIKEALTAVARREMGDFRGDEVGDEKTSTEKWAENLLGCLEREGRYVQETW